MNRQRRRQLELVIARVAEAAYRRGFQQGHDTATRGQALEVDVARWRFGVPLHRAPSPHGYRETTAADRLRIEEPTLGQALEGLVGDDSTPPARGRRITERTMNDDRNDDDATCPTTCPRCRLREGATTAMADEELRQNLLDTVERVRAVDVAEDDEEQEAVEQAAAMVVELVDAITDMTALDDEGHRDRPADDPAVVRWLHDQRVAEGGDHD